MAKFKFETKNGNHVAACETTTIDKAWAWICSTKKLNIDQAKDLYTITKIK